MMRPWMHPNEMAWSSTNLTSRLVWKPTDSTPTKHWQGTKNRNRKYQAGSLPAQTRTVQSAARKKKEQLPAPPSRFLVTRRHSRLRRRGRNRSRGSGRNLTGHRGTGRQRDEGERRRSHRRHDPERHTTHTHHNASNNTGKRPRTAGKPHPCHNRTAARRHTRPSADPTLPPSLKNTADTTDKNAEIPFAEAQCRIPSLDQLQQFVVASGAHHGDEQFLTIDSVNEQPVSGDMQFPVFPKISFKLVVTVCDAACRLPHGSEYERPHTPWSCHNAYASDVWHRV